MIHSIVNEEDLDLVIDQKVNIKNFKKSGREIEYVVYMYEPLLH